MRIECADCGWRAAVPDDSVAGRRVKVRCRGCDRPIVVDGLDAVTTEELVEESTWEVSAAEGEYRAMSTSELLDAFRDGELGPEHFVWREGMPDWRRLLEVEELAQALAQGPGGGSPVFGGEGPVFAGGGPARLRPRSETPSADLFAPSARSPSLQPRATETSGLFTLGALRVAVAGPGSFGADDRTPVPFEFRRASRESSRALPEEFQERDSVPSLPPPPLFRSRSSEPAARLQELPGPLPAPPALPMGLEDTPPNVQLARPIALGVGSAMAVVAVAVAVIWFAGWL